MRAKRTKMVEAVGAALLLLILSVSSASAGVEIAISSPPQLLDNLVVTPGLVFAIDIWVGNLGDNAFIVALEAGDLPITFAENGFELAAGKSTYIKTTFKIPSGWLEGEVYEGNISATALTPEGAPGGMASGHVIGSVSKCVVLTVENEQGIFPGNPEFGEPIENQPYFAWTCEGANSFRLLIDNDSDFSSPCENRILFENHYQIPPENTLDNGVYYWKVIAYYEGGEIGSDVWSFVVGSEETDNTHSPIEVDYNEHGLSYAAFFILLAIGGVFIALAARRNRRGES